jgi:hypothetical protein
VSQVVQFDARQEGGCPRRWAFDKIFGKKDKIEDPNDPRLRGKRYAREGELYLKYNYDALSPVMRSGKHLLPAPGSDLEVEEPMAGSAEATVAALALRDRALKGEVVSDEEVAKVARLTACGIPFVGAADYAHHRGVYVTRGGVVVDEPYPDVTAEVGDHKTTARINDHTTKPRKKGGQPVVLSGYAKTPEQIGMHPQMLGYGIWQKAKHPHLKYIRLSHNYYQTKNGYTADKRSILLTVDEIIDRWHSTVVPVAREMVDVARVSKIEDVPYNLKACRQFGRDCIHAEYCDRPARDFIEIVNSMFGERGFDMDMSVLFPGASNGVAHQPTVQAPPTLPVQSDEERQRLIEEEKAKLNVRKLEGVEGYKVGQPCNGRGYYASANGQGFIDVESGHSCSVCANAPALPGGVNPADAPPVDHVAAADSLTPEAIAEITDPALRALAEANAKAHAERQQKQEAKKPSGCSGIGQRIEMTDAHKLHRKVICPGCGKSMKVKDEDIDLTVQPLVLVVPKHRVGLASVPAIALAAPAPAPAPVPAAVPPPLPSASPPLLPQVAPSLKEVIRGALAGKSLAEGLRALADAIEC